MKCIKCGQEVQDSVKYHSECEAEIVNYPKPAGFWIRVVAYFIDGIVFIPIVVLNFFNLVSIKSMFLLILICIPGFIYKPFMESFFGATLGKMACKIRVIDKHGEKLTLGTAYIRFLPFLLSTIVGLIGALVLFSFPEFKNVTTFLEIGQLQQRNPIKPITTIVSLFVFVDCVFIAFTHRKRAIHDMMARSFCVFKQS